MNPSAFVASFILCVHLLSSTTLCGGHFELEASQLSKGLANKGAEEQMAGRVGPDGNFWPEQRG